MAELIFVVDSEVEASRHTQRCLEQAGHSVRTFTTIADVEEALEYKPSFLLIAATLSDCCGLDLC